MDKGEEIRRRREALGWSQPDLAKKIKGKQQTISRIETGETVMSRAIPKILKVLDEAEGKAVVKETPVIAEALPHGPNTMPVYTSAEGGPGTLIMTFDAIEYLPMAAPLMGVKNGYAMYVVGDSMEPLFKQGDLLLVNPHLPHRAGDDVLIYKEIDGEVAAMVKTLVRAYPGSWTLLQYNPNKTFELDRDEWPHCHVIVGKYNRPH